MIRTTWRTYRLSWLVPTMLCVCAGLVSGQQHQPADMTAKTDGGCRICDQIRGGGVQLVASADADATCLRCHDGVTASAERHPVGRTFEGTGVRLVTGWPAPAGKLSCLTCHDIELACDQGGRQRAANPAFLRGGPGRRPIDFCARCHVDDARQQRYNPHTGLSASAPTSPACLYCHSRSPDRRPGRQATGPVPALRGDAVSICLGCHRRHVDYFAPGHVGATATPTMRRRIARAGHRLWLDADGKVACATCHDPHRVSDAIGDSGTAANPDSTPARPPALRGYGTNICGVCHGH